MMRSSLAPAVLAATLLVSACGLPQAAQEEEPQFLRPTVWAASAQEHIGLWYHSLAYAAQAGGRPAETADPAVLPHFDPQYVERITEAKRARGVGETVLDRRAEEFGRIFAGDDAYQGLQFLPLYFSTASGLFAAIELWNEVGADPERVEEPAQRAAIAFLSRMFPAAAQREVVTEWAQVVRQEADAFYHAYWLDRAAEMHGLASRVERAWQPIEAAIRPYLEAMDLRGGEIIVAPALGVEGRSVLRRGTQTPRVASLAPPSEEAAENTVWAVVHELLYPLVAELIAESPSAADLAAPDREALATRAAVRGGALLLELSAPDAADAYRRYYLERTAAAAGEARSTFEEAFPLPQALESGLAERIESIVAEG